MASAAVNGAPPTDAVVAKNAGMVEKEKTPLEAVSLGGPGGTCNQVRQSVRDGAVTRAKSSD